MEGRGRIGGGPGGIWKLGTAHDEDQATRPGADRVRPGNTVDRNSADFSPHLHWGEAQ